MTVGELGERLTVRELLQWDEFFDMERKASERAAKQAEQATKGRGR